MIGIKKAKHTRLKQKQQQIINLLKMLCIFFQIMNVRQKVICQQVTEWWAYFFKSREHISSLLIDFF